MKFDENLDREYLLLLAYKNLGMRARSILIQMCFDSLNKLGTNDSFLEFFGPEQEQERSKQQIRGMFQLEIISKIMFCIEDLVIITESIRQGKHYYSLLKEDVGVLVGTFFQNLDSLNDDEICRIMSYVIPAKSDLGGGSLDLLKKHIDSNVTEVKRFFKELDSFGKQHHPVFKRFKHAGMPFIPGLLSDLPPEFLKNFKSFVQISVGEDPLNDIKIIPYSSEILEGYKIIVNSCFELLTEMIDNRLRSIQCNVDGIIPHNMRNVTIYSIEEMKKIQELVEMYYVTHPATNTEVMLHSNPIHKKEDYSWYVNLETFLSECENNAKIQEKYKKDLVREGIV